MTQQSISLSRSQRVFTGFAALGALVAVALACSPQPPAESPSSATPTSDPQPGVTAEDAAADGTPPTETPASETGVAKFEDMKPGEQMEYMKNTVLPEMTKLFQAYDPKEFAEVRCTTCHGSRAKKGDFEMPNEELPKLDVSDHLADEQKAHPEMMKFMMEKVTPTMAKLLGEELFDPATGHGFGCLGCHTKAEPSTSAAPAAKPAAKH